MASTDEQVGNAEVVITEDTDLYGIAVPDPEHTLGGIKGDIEPEHPSVIGHIVKSLMPGQDLTRVTIPAFFLEPRSLLERMADTMMHPDLMLNVSQMEDPLDRFKSTLRWYLSGWHYKTTGVKKPYNPIIGETFACFWDHEDGSRSQYFAEQVLHRPPISAIYFENRQHNMTASAHVWTKSQFSAPQTTKSILDGACILHLTNLNEEYYMTFPTYYAHNLLIGQLRMEVGDTAHIVCKKTGLRADIDFHQRTLFGKSDVLNSVTATVYTLKEDGRTKDKELFTITGHWDKKLYINVKGSKPELFLDVTSLKVAPKMVLPISAQGPWESRRLWQYATKYLNTRPKVDWNAVEREKGHLEEEQRLVPCHFKPGSKEFKEWKTKKFQKQKVLDPITNQPRELYIFDDMKLDPYTPDEPKLNVLKLSRELPDPRGGLNGAGAEVELVDAMKSVKVSKHRVADWEKL